MIGTMAHVSALYRHPVKGFTPEPVESLTVTPDGRVSGDRVFAFRFGNATEPEDRKGLDYWPKSKGLSLQDFPSLAPLRLRYDSGSMRVTLTLEGSVLFDGVLDDTGREDLVTVITRFVEASPEAKKLARDGRLPLSLVGDGRNSRFQDRARGFVSVHSAASVTQLGEALGMRIDDRRFRSNIVIDGVAPGAELEWGHTVRIGEVEFNTAGPIVRCLATHANPDTGERDAPVLKTLTGALSMTEPCLGRLLLPVGVVSEGAKPGTTDTGFGGGVIRIGDSVTVQTA